ncbi:MAG: tetratricopeptide repeat protein [Planctomycetes bacterium]|nr:tetratricopeptide repeat protein [Planctomycetota bacterium]
MSDRQDEQKNADNKSRPGGQGRNVRIILLALIAVVAGLALYVAFSPPPRPQTELPQQPPDQGKQVLAAAEKLIREAQADAIGDELRMASYRQARDLLWSYNLKNPRNTETLLLLADVSLRLCRMNAHDSANMFAQANQAVDIVLEMAPNSSRGLWLKGELVRRRGGKDFMDYFARAADSPASDWQVWTAYGMELINQGKADQARRYVDRAAASGATGAGTRKILLARAELAFAAGQYAQARELFRQAADSDTADMHAWLMLARATEKSADPAATLKTLDEAVDALRDRLKGEIFFMKGSILARSGDWEKASAAFVSATADPAVRAHAALEAAKCFYELKRYAPAMGYIDIAAQQMPGDDPELKQLMAKIEDARFGNASSNRSTK